MPKQERSSREQIQSKFLPFEGNAKEETLQKTTEFINRELRSLQQGLLDRLPPKELKAALQNGETVAKIRESLESMVDKFVEDGKLNATDFGEVVREKVRREAQKLLAAHQPEAPSSEEQQQEQKQPTYPDTLTFEGSSGEAAEQQVEAFIDDEYDAMLQGLLEKIEESEMSEDAIRNGYKQLLGEEMQRFFSDDQTLDFAAFRKYAHNFLNQEFQKELTLESISLDDAQQELDLPRYQKDGFGEETNRKQREPQSMDVQETNSSEQVGTAEGREAYMKESVEDLINYAVATLPESVRQGIDLEKARQFYLTQAERKLDKLIHKSRAKAFEKEWQQFIDWEKELMKRYAEADDPSVLVMAPVFMSGENRFKKQEASVETTPTNTESIVKEKQLAVKNALDELEALLLKHGLGSILRKSSLFAKNEVPGVLHSTKLSIDLGRFFTSDAPDDLQPKGNLFTRLVGEPKRKNILAILDETGERDEIEKLFKAYNRALIDRAKVIKK